MPATTTAEPTATTKPTTRKRPSKPAPEAPATTADTVAALKPAPTKPAKPRAAKPAPKVAPKPAESAPTEPTIPDGYKVHPAADIFPMIQGDDFAALVDDIKANGLREPVIVLDGVVIDGRNRLAACAAAGIEPTTEPYQGDASEAGILRFIVSRNMRRRHLTIEERARLALTLEPMFKAAAKQRQRAAGGDRKSAAARSVTASAPQANGGKRAPTALAQAAAAAGVSESTARKAKQRAEGKPPRRRSSGSTRIKSGGVDPSKYDPPIKAAMLASKLSDLADLLEKIRKDSKRLDGKDADALAEAVEAAERVMNEADVFVNAYQQQ